jgi:hypothetical protein
MRNISDKVVEKKHIIHIQLIFFLEIRTVYGINFERHCIAGQATDDNMAHAHFMLYTIGYKQTFRI